MGDPRLAAARRIRGKGRHFRSVLREAEGFAIAPAATKWWDLWRYSRLERYFVLYSPALGESLEQPLIEKKP